MRLIFALLLVTASLSLTACGQKGPLYLPDAEQSEQSEEKR